MSNIQNINFNQLGLILSYSGGKGIVQTIISDISTGKKIINFYSMIYTENPNMFDLNNYIKSNNNLNIFDNKYLIEINEYDFNSKIICLFYYREQWIITYDNNISVLSERGGIVENIICELYENKILDTDKLNTQLSYWFILKHNSLRKIGYCYDEYQPPTINLLRVSGKEGDIGIDDKKKINFSCMDQLIISLNTMGCGETVNKRINICGYNIRIYHSDTYYQFGLRTNTYNKINELISDSNQYKLYLKLYQQDILNEILPYIHKYHIDIIKRINVAFRTLSKEIVNIYHLTRKKQNVLLYEQLTPIYKKILFDLHKIYVVGKHSEYTRSESEDNDSYEKKSISVNIVYNYLKSSQSNDVIQLFFDRKKLIDNLQKANYIYDEIIYEANIDILIHTELMMK